MTLQSRRRSLWLERRLRRSTIAKQTHLRREAGSPLPVTRPCSLLNRKWGCQAQEEGRSRRWLGLLLWDSVGRRKSLISELKQSADMNHCNNMSQESEREKKCYFLPLAFLWSVGRFSRTVFKIWSAANVRPRLEENWMKSKYEQYQCDGGWSFNQNLRGIQMVSNTWN